MLRTSLRKNRKGQLGGATNIAVGLIVLVLIVAIGAIILGDFADTAAECSTGFTFNETADNCYNTTNSSLTTAVSNAAWNASQDGITGLTNMSAQFGTVGTVAIAAVLLSLVVGAFVVTRR